MDAKGPSREALSAAFSVFDERGRPGEPLTTSEVAESLDCSRRATYDRLGKLADQGYVDTKKAGAKGRVWWLAKQPDEGSDEGGTAADREEEELRYVVADGQIFEEADLDPDEVVNASLPAFLPAETAETMEPHFEAAFDGEERTFDVEYAGRIFRMQTIPVTDDGGEVLAGMAVARDVTEQRERERQLESQREQLAALNDLNGVVREINEALTRQSTREEVEEVVCNRLAASDSYEFAWIGDVDTSSKTVTLRAEAGVEGYLDDTTISIDPDDPHSQGAAGRAFQTGEMQVDRRVLDDPAYEPWHDHVRDFGFRSLTSIPVTHEETLYGLLNVYSAREDAFEYEERAVLGQLGEIVGHTIASIERKRALMGDELVEVEFRIPQVFDVFDVPSTDGRITFDRTVPIGDGIYLVYGTVTEDALETLKAMVETIPHWEGLTMIEEGFDESSFELRLSEPPAISLVATQGGYVKEAVIEDDYDMTVHLPQGADIQYVVDAIQEAYPPAEALTRRQVSREDMSTAEYRQTLVDDLTERQRSVLQAAYFSGFFEWPRESSGQDVAESLGISDATFHQHVRLARAKLVDTLFADPATRVS